MSNAWLWTALVHLEIPLNYIQLDGQTCTVVDFSTPADTFEPYQCTWAYEAANSGYKIYVGIPDDLRHHIEVNHGYPTAEIWDIWVGPSPPSLLVGVVILGLGIAGAVAYYLWRRKR